MFAVAGLALVLAQGEDPLDLLSTLQRELLAGLRPGVDRLKARVAARDAFNQDLNRAVVRRPREVWDHYVEYLGRLAEADRFFPAQERKHEREVWIAACRAALLKQASQARFDNPPTTVEMFQACTSAVDRARSRLSGDDLGDLRKSAFESVNLIFRPLLRTCQPAPKDASAVHASQMSWIKARFGESNEFPQGMLRDISRACLDRDVTARR